MAATTVANVAGSIPIKWQNELLKTADGYLVMDKFANTDVMGMGDGDRIRINRVLRPVKQTTASTAGTLIAPASAKNLLTDYIDLPMEIWGDTFGFNEDMTIQSIVQDPAIKEAVANHMARSIDYQVSKRISTEGMRYRIDGDSTYYVNGTVDSATTTTIVDDALTQIDDHFNGGRCTITNAAGPGYDQTHKVTDFTASSDTMTFGDSGDAWTKTTTTASKYSVTVGTNLAATDVYTTAGILKMAAFHEKFQTEKFEGGTIRAFLHPDQKADLWGDSGFTDSATNVEAKRFRNYSIVRWLDVEFMISSEIYREDVDGTENQASGVVYVSPFFGKNSYSVIRFGNKGAGSKFGIEFIPVDTADSQNLRNSAKYLSWKGNFALGVTRATSMVGLMTGATDLGIIV